MSSPFVFIYFLPENTLYNRSLTIIHEQSLFGSESKRKLSNELKELYIFVKKKPEKHLEYRKLNYHPSPLHKAIRDDNVEELQSLMSRNNIGVNHTIKFSFYERTDFGKELNLSEIAAVYGSVNVFKFLWMQVDFIINQDLLQYAYAGSNFDIIHLCETKCSEIGAIKYAIMSSRFDLIDYYLDKYEISEEDEIQEKLNEFITNTNEENDDEGSLYGKLNYDTLCCALECFNYDIIVKCLPKITFLAKYYDFEKEGKFQSTYLLILNCLYDEDLFDFMYHQKIHKLDSVFNMNLLHSAKQNANDCFKKLAFTINYDDSINFLFESIFDNHEIANFMLDELIILKKTKRTILFYHLFQSQCPQLMELAIQNYNEDIVEKMIILYSSYTDWEICNLSIQLKHNITKDMITSLLNRVTPFMPPETMKALNKIMHIVLDVPC